MQRAKKETADVDRARWKFLIDNELAHEHISLSKFGARLEISSCVISQHYSKLEKPISVAFAIKYADYFGVSLDWLYGLTDAMSPETTIRDIEEYTGLSKETIKLFHENNVFIRALDQKIQGGSFEKLIEYLRWHK